MKRLILLLLLCLVSPLWAETLPVTLWQKETRHQLKQRQTVRLDRGSFHLVMPIAKNESIGVAAGPGFEVPKELEAFGPARGMAGPYDGIFLTWEAFHYFHVDTETGDPRMDLWDRKRGLYHWKAFRFYDNTGSGAKVLSWADVPNFTLIFRKDGFDDLTVFVEWDD